MSARVDPIPGPLYRWVLGARPRTLAAAVVPVAVGAACAVGVDDGSGAEIEVMWWRVVAALVVSLALQVGVNYANDYSDGVRGSDDDRVGPLRLVASGAASPLGVKRAALLAFAVAAVVGLAVAIATSWLLIAVGLVSIAAAWGYTGGRHPYGYRGLGELFVFVFFGLVATMGTTYVAIERVTLLSADLAVGVGCLACALLVVNNLRDRERDALVGKRTLAVVLGDRTTRIVYTGLIGVAFVMVVIAAIERRWVLLGFAAAVAALGPTRRVLGGATDRELIAVLGATGRVQIVYGVGVVVGVLASA